MTAFDCAFAEVIGVEGVYSCDPHDRGNWTGGAEGVGELKGTKYGVSAHQYPHLDIKNLTLEDAKAIYLRDFWTPIKGDQLPLTLAILVFDSAVNQGAETAARLLQAAVKVTPDGSIGPQTLAAIKKIPSGEAIALFMAERAMRYTRSGDFGRYGFSWFARLFRADAAALKASTT